MASGVAGGVHRTQRNVRYTLQLYRLFIVNQAIDFDDTA
jgi:hypothetical protein